MPQWLKHPSRMQNDVGSTRPPSMSQLISLLGICVVLCLVSFPAPPSSQEGTRLCCVVLLYVSGVPMAFNVITDIPLKKRTIYSSRLSSHTSLGICEVLNCRYTVHKLYSLPFCMHATFSFTSAAQLSGVSYMYIYIYIPQLRLKSQVTAVPRASEWREC